MKKNYLLSALALSAMLGVTSCSSDDAPQVAADGETSFTVRLPEELGSRTFGDGKSATTLKYAVYEHGSIQPITLSDGENFGTAQFNNLQTTVSLNLPRGTHYDITFRAPNPDAPYTFSAENRNVTIDYEAGYTEENDAFSYVLKNFAITTATSQTVTLKRPFAQLNIGTTDYDMADMLGLKVTQTAVTVKDVYTQFNFMDGEQGDVAKDSKKDAVFALADLPAAGETFPVTDPANIKYLSMNYILVPADKMTTSVTFSCNDTDYTPYTFENVPFQRNYRTNIYGRLLTAPAEFQVVIDPSFEEPDYNVTEVSVKNYRELTAALGLDYVTIHLTKDLGNDLHDVPGNFVVTGRNVTIDLGGHKISSMSGCFEVKGSCESFSIANGSLVTARGKDQSAIYVNEAGTKKVTVNNVNLDHFTWDGIQITSPTLEEININKCNFPGSARGWTLTCQRYIHIEFRKDGTYMVPMSECKVNITNNTFPMPRYIREEAVGVYQVNPAGVTFTGNILRNSTGNAAGKWAGKPYELFNFWNLDSEGQWINWGAADNNAFLKAGLTINI